MKLLSLMFTSLLAFFLVTRVRRVMAVTLVGTIAFTVVAPPAKAQLGIPAVVAAAAQVVRTINNVIGPLLKRNSGHNWGDQRSAQSVPQSLGTGRVPTAVDQSSAGAGEFNDRPVSRSPHRSDAGECVKRPTAKPSVARRYHSQSRYRGFRSTDQRLRPDLPRNSANPRTRTR